MSLVNKAKLNLNNERMRSLELLTEDVLKSYDVVVVATDHTVFDLELIAASSKVIVDTRNAFKGFTKRDNIILIGEGK